MIVFRYLAKEVYTTLCAVTAVLLLIFLSHEFVRYLTKAAAGKIGVGIVFKIMAVQLPYLLGLLLPAGLFVGILLAYGRLYVDQEMTVLSSCGMSTFQLVTQTVKASFLLMFIVGLLSLYISPRLLAYQSELKVTSEADLLLQTLMPGRFYLSSGDKHVYYIESVSRDRNEVQHVFFAKQEKIKSADDPSKDETVWNVTSAERGYQTFDPEASEHFMVAVDGHRYFGIPGTKNFRMMHFDKYGIRLDMQSPTVKKPHEGMTNRELLHLRKQDPDARAELQWRVALPLSVPVLALLAVPLSRVRPRRGRYSALLPAILIYTIYANMMFVSRSWLESDVIPRWIGLWWLPIVLTLLAFALLIERRHWQLWLGRFRRSRSAV